MPKLIELELRRTRLRPYLLGAAILTAAILGFYLLMGAMPSLSALAFSASRYCSPRSGKDS